MNTSLLKYLVSLAGNQVDAIDTTALFKKYPKEAYSSELYSLAKMGFISVTTNFNDIGVNQKAIDYIAKL